MNKWRPLVGGALFGLVAIVAASAGHCCVAIAQPVPSPVASPAGPSLSLTRDQAISLALANNLTYRSAIADADAARGRVIQAGAGHLPSVSSGYQYIHTQYAAFFAFPAPSPSPHIQQFQFSAKDTNNLNATLQYALYTGGAVEAAIGEAAAGLAAAESQLAATRATVIRDTTSDYFQLVSTRDVALIDQQAVSVARQNLDVANKQYRAGTAAKADVLRAQVTLANAEVASVQGSNAAALANAALANLLNINLASQITPTEPLEVPMPSYTLADIMSDAKSRRPELAAAHDAVAIAEAAVRGARADSLPTIALEVQEASSKPNFINVPQPNLTETLSAAWKLFDGGLSHGKVVEAKAQLDKANIQLKQIDNDIDLEARQAYLNFEAALAAVSAAKSSQSSADENLRVTEIRYRAGVGTSLELSDAELADTQARTQVVNALVNLRTALTNLQRAAGLL